MLKLLQKQRCDDATLAAAFEDYGGTIQYERGRAVEVHADEQRRVAQEVPAPSPELAEILRLPASAQHRDFEAMSATRQELTRLSVALQKRLSPSDHRALRLGDRASLEQSLKISPAQAQQVSRVHAQVADATKQVRVQQQDLAKTQGTALKITR